MGQAEYKGGYRILETMLKESKAAYFRYKKEGDVGAQADLLMNGWWENARTIFDAVREKKGQVLYGAGKTYMHELGEIIKELAGLSRHHHGLAGSIPIAESEIQRVRDYIKEARLGKRHHGHLASIGRLPKGKANAHGGVDKIMDGND